MGLTQQPVLWSDGPNHQGKDGGRGGGGLAAFPRVRGEKAGEEIYRRKRFVLLLVFSSSLPVALPFHLSQNLLCKHLGGAHFTDKETEVQESSAVWFLLFLNVYLELISNLHNKCKFRITAYRPPGSLTVNLYPTCSISWSLVFPLTA